jgi:starch synthase
MRAPPPVVEIGNPGAMHFSYALVAAVQALGYGGCFHTAFYYRPADWRAPLALLPRGLRARLLRQLERRRHAGVDPARVRLAPGGEALRLLGGRLGLPEGAQHRLLLARNRAADRRLATLVRRRRPAAVIAHDTAALATMTAAAAVGSLGILNQVVGHRVAGERVLRAEAMRHPAFAGSLGHRPDAALTEICRQEALAAGLVLAPSDYVRDTLLEIGVPAERIALLPFGVDVERFRPAAGPRPPGPLRLLFVGQLAQRKGLAYLLEALRRLPPGLCRATLVGPLAVPRAALAPYADLIEHRAALPYHEVHAVFAAADLFVYPSLHEGSALAIYEALASGLPTITTHSSGSILRHGVEGLLVPAGDAEALAAALVALAGDPARRAAMATAARARALEHTWMHYRARLAAILAAHIGPA